jgi:transcriptional regulator with XRE-family HTH domain
MEDMDMKFEEPEVIKPKRKSNGKNSPVVGNNGIIAKPDEMGEVGAELLDLYQMQPVTTDKECSDRMNWYLQWSIERAAKGHGRPTIGTMAMAMGVARNTLWEWENGKLGSPRANIIKKGKEFIQTFLDELAMSGKVNPVTWIFYAKNYFGMTDSQNITITPNNRDNDTIPFDDLKKLADQHSMDYDVSADSKEE